MALNDLLCMPLPLTNETIELVDVIPEEGKKYYWNNQNNYRVQDSKIACMIASKLLEYNRPLAAIDAINPYGHSSIDKLDSDLVANILSRILTNPSDINRLPIQRLDYDILKAIELLQNSGKISEIDLRQIEWEYLNIFRDYQEFSPRYLMKCIAEEPSFFAQLVIWIFGRDDNQKDPIEDLPEDLIRQRAEILLRKVDILPGQTGGNLDEILLKDWVDRTRNILSDAGRSKIGDYQIGEYLSHCPKGTDGIWPHESIRAIIEQVSSQDLDRGIQTGHVNAIGATFRYPYDGGKQEPSLAEQYSSDAESIQLISPRTAAILRSIAESDRSSRGR